MHSNSGLRKTITLFIIVVLAVSFLLVPMLSSIPAVYAANPLTPKWTATGVPFASIGALVADVTGDSNQEIIQAGEGGVAVFDGRTGNKIANMTVPGADSSAQFECADLNKDGKFEIVVASYLPARLYAFYGNGSSYWTSPTLGGRSPSNPVIADIDGNGVPTVFVADMWTTTTSNDGKLTALNGRTGAIIKQVWSWHSCAGGLSIADADNDGRFELYLGDRPNNYGDGNLGRGLVSYWADDLSERWARPEILCSSNRPMLADVNNDGILEVIIGYHRGGLAVVNSTDGSYIYNGLSLGSATAPVHYQPSAYDIDGDGHLEMLMADGEHNLANKPVVFDLVTHTVDATLNCDPGKFGPETADVTGDGKKDIIVANNNGIYIFNGTYASVQNVTGLPFRLLNPVVADIDGDLLNELIVTQANNGAGRIYAYDTPATTPIRRPRSEVHFYSERRLGAQEYVPPPGAQAPIISSPSPANGATNVSVSLPQLSFTLADFQKDPMSYTVTTVPNIGSGSNSGVANGVQTVGISGLTFSTVYTWQVNATDGTNWTNKTFKFTTQAIPPWWNTSWQYRRMITIDHTKVSSDQTDFPVLIDPTDAGLVTKAQTNGNDFVFTDSNQAKLSHEIESYDSVTGHLTVWIKVPVLSSTIDTLLYMYYGNKFSGDQQDKNAVWDSSNRMVLHLSEKTGTQFDSTVNVNNGTPFNGVVQGTNGKIDGSDTFDGVDDYVQVAHSNTISGFTVALTASFWLRLTDVSRRQTFLNKYNSGTGQRSWYIEYQTNRLGFFASQDGTAYKEWHASFTPIAGTWYYITVVWQTNTIPKFYVNGVQVTTTGATTTLASIYNNVGVPLYIGRCPYDATRYLKGGLDEIRISNPARSAGWILTCFNNQQNPSIFYNVGAEEALPSEPQVSNPYPANTATNVPISLTKLNFTLLDYQNDAMTFYVTTNPDVGSSTSGATNGNYSVNISGLEYSKTYTWQLNVTDGTHWTNKTYMFTTESKLVQLLVDSQFDGSSDSADLRANGPGQDWYESRGAFPGGDSNLLFLDTSNIGGDSSKKAGFTASESANAYLTQEFSSAQTGVFTAQWDIYDDSVLRGSGGSNDIAGIMMIGIDSGSSPNRQGGDRFVYMAFSKPGGGTTGTMSLIAINPSTTIAPDLNLKQWYTIKVVVNVPAGTYDVYVDGAFKATINANAALTSLTHISLAQWDDGAGAFYVDNVYAFTQAPGNQAPIIDSYYPTADPTIMEGTSQEFNVTYHDPEGDATTVQWYRNGTKTVSTDSYTFRAQAGSAGTYDVNVTITDKHGAQASKVWKLSVLNLADLGNTLLMPFDSNQTPVAVDESGYGNNGTVTGADWTSDYGGCYFFNATEKDYITVPDAVSLDGGGTWSEITIEFWIKPTVDNTGVRLIEKRSAGSSYQIGFQTTPSPGILGNQLYWDIWTSTGYAEVVAPFGLPTGEWSHVACTYKDGTGLTIYVNGTIAVSGTYTGTIADSLCPISIGRRGNDSSYFTGFMDDIRLYMKALPQTLIAQQYGETKNPHT